MNITNWQPILQGEIQKPYWDSLSHFIEQERKDFTVFPSEEKVLLALHATSYRDVKVVILGQDPYHGDGQAMGLSFSVPEGAKLPPSLVNIYKELENDLGVTPPESGNLIGWAEQGVLLLNSVLTVRAHQAASHQAQGWEQFTDAILTAVNNKNQHVVFVLWGGFAKKKKTLIDTSRHTVIESAHPSPLSAYSGFFGSKPFSRVNESLLLHDQTPIRWTAR